MTTTSDTTADPGTGPEEITAGSQGSDGGTAAKWYRDGTPRPFPGNTFVSFDPDAALHEALMAAHDLIRDSEAADAFAVLPAESLHLTVLDGSLGTDLTGRANRRWPAFAPATTPIEILTGAFVNRIRAARLHVPEELGFTVEGVSDVDDPSAQFEVLLTPDDDTRAALHGLRSRLISLLEIPAAAEPHRSHVTLAYRLRESVEDADEIAQLQERIEAILPSHTVFRGIALAVFPDMTSFEPVMWL